MKVSAWTRVFSEPFHSALVTLCYIIKYVFENNWVLFYWDSQPLEGKLLQIKAPEINTGILL